jgi:hypothetical protein
MSKKEFTGRYDWRVVLDVESAGAQVNLYEFATKDGETDGNWIVVDKGEQLDWLIETLIAIKEEK